MTLAKIFFVLLALAYPTKCHGDRRVTEVDNARLSGLLEDLASRHRNLQDKVTSNQVNYRFVETTVNRLMSENAQLKASVNLLEEAVSQRARLENISTRLNALEASSSETTGAGPASECVCGDVATTRDTACSFPFTEVFGRCVYVDSTTSGTWEEMRQHCRGMDADLVIIDTADFLWHLIRHLQETGQDRSSYWVGGHRKNGKGNFHWVDGSPMKMGTPFWGHGNDFKHQQPYDSATELHICIYDKGLFFLHSCGITHMQPPICQRK